MASLCLCSYSFGCTTGYEASRTGTPVFDVSHLIDHTKPSLSAYCSTKPDSLQDLAQQLQLHYANDNLSEFSSSPSLISSDVYSSAISPSSSLITSFNEFLNTSSSYISKKVSNIHNASYIFPSNSFYYSIDSAIPSTAFSSSELFESNIKKYSDLTANFPPVYLKSRSLRPLTSEIGIFLLLLHFPSK